jgi:uncharacterized membrane protein YhfC
MDILFRLVNALLMIAMPLVLGLFLARRLRVGWRLFVVGAVTFVGSQVLHLPFNTQVLSLVIERLGLTEVQTGVPLAVVALLYGLSAGVFEEVARYLVYRLQLKEVTSWGQALMFGAGHGGVEAILLGGLAAYALFQAVAYRGVDLNGLVPPEQLELATAQLEAYWSAPWYSTVLGAVERAFTLCFHLSASLLVLKAITRKKPVWLVLAVGWHALVNAVTLFAFGTWGAYVAEGLIGLMALFSLWIVFTLRKHEGGDGDPAHRVLPEVENQIPGVDPAVEEITKDDLEDSRYM